MPKLRNTEKNCKVTRAVEDVAEWIHTCYLLSVQGEPGIFTPWVDISEKVQAKYCELAKAMLATPLGAWLKKRNRNTDVAERIEL